MSALETLLEVQDHDTRIDLIGFDPFTSQIVTQEAAVTVGFTNEPEFNPAIASRFSSSGTRSLRYATANEHNLAAPFSVEAWSYDGFAPGGFSTRPTQCGTALSIATLQKYSVARYFEDFRCSAHHEIEPVGMLGGGSLVRPGELGHVQRIFVAVNNERHFGHVPLVQPVARDAAFCGPAAEVPRAFSQPVREFLRLSFGGGQQTTKRGADFRLGVG